MKLNLKIVSLRISSALLSGALSLCASAQTSATQEAQTALSKPYVSVNGEPQPNAHAEVLLREQLAHGAPDGAELRNAVREQLINQTMMAQEARKTGLDKMPLVQAQVELAGQAVLARAWQQKVLSEVVVKDDQIKAEYAALIARLGKQEYLVRHLLVADESTAKLLIEKLQSGAKMADLAAQYSRDASTKDHGGLTDWTPAGNFLPPVADVVVKLEKGKVWPQAVHSNAGWHILQLEDKRPFTAPTMEAIKPQLTQLIARRELEAQAQALKAKAVVQ